MFTEHTMDMVKDYEGQIPRSPQTTGRTILRTTLVILLTTFLLTILILFFTIGAPSVRTTRHYRETAANELKQQEKTFGNTSDTWTCPCQSQVSYSDFMTINLTRSADDPGILLQIDDNSYYNAPNNTNTERYLTCQNLTKDACGRFHNTSLHFQSDMGCDTTLFSTMTKRGTVMPFNYVSKANLVWQAAASQAQVALLRNIPYRLEWYMDDEHKKEWLCLEDLLTVLTFIWNLVAINDTQMPDAAAFWNSNLTLTSGNLPYGAVWSFSPYNTPLDGDSPLLNTSNTTLLEVVQYQPVMPVVHFNWSGFIDACDVPYCDVTEHSPVWYKAFTAFSQIGGFTTVAVVTLRVVLWPLCSWLLLSNRLPKTASTTASAPNWQQSIPVRTLCL